MKSAHPHFLLFSEANVGKEANVGNSQGTAKHDQWRFVLESVEDGQRFSVTELEPETSGERLELLAVVRGLEALDQPSRVTLVTTSRYVSQGLRRGLEDWRSNSWKWERFGRLVPVKNSDLWQRIDRALQFHQLECRTWRFETPTTTSMTESARAVGHSVSIRRRPRMRPQTPSVGRWMGRIAQALRGQAAVCPTA